MNNTNYPISSHYFPNLIDDNAIYVDKTQFIVPLLEKKNECNVLPQPPSPLWKVLVYERN